MGDVLAQVRRAATAEALTHRWVWRLAAMITFVLLTTLGGYLEVPLPGTQVPVTLQTLFVSLSGLLLGPRLGAGAMALYVAAGALGAPVFAGGAFGIARLMGPTGGYLLAFPAAAAVTGALAARVPRTLSWRNALLLGVATFLGTVVVFVGGAAQLALLTGDAGRAVELGVLPFIAGDLAKVLLAVAVALRLRNRTLGLL
jgi:biotin transport system substrate-specific component